MTGLQRYTPKAFMGIASFLMRFAGQPVCDCALPALYIATSPKARSGAFYGPTGKFNKGSAGERDMPEKAKDAQLIVKLWDISEQLTGVKYLG